MRVYIQQHGRGVYSARTPLHIVDEEQSPHRALCGFWPYVEMYTPLEYDAERDGQRQLCRRCQAQQDRRAGRLTSKQAQKLQARIEHWQANLDAWRKMVEAGESA